MAAVTHIDVGMTAGSIELRDGAAKTNSPGGDITAG